MFLFGAGSPLDSQVLVQAGTSLRCLGLEEIHEHQTSPIIPENLISPPLVVLSKINTYLPSYIPIYLFFNYLSLIRFRLCLEVLSTPRCSSKQAPSYGVWDLKRSTNTRSFHSSQQTCLTSSPLVDLSISKNLPLTLLSILSINLSAIN